MVDNYIRNCAWAEDAALFVDPTEIICESYRDKVGSQKMFQQDNPLELVEGQNYYQKKKKLFDNVVGFAKFSQYLIVAEVRFHFFSGVLSDCFSVSIRRGGSRLICRFPLMDCILRRDYSRRLLVLTNMFVFCADAALLTLTVV